MQTVTKSEWGGEMLYERANNRRPGDQ